MGGGVLSSRRCVLYVSFLVSARLPLLLSCSVTALRARSLVIKRAVSTYTRARVLITV